MPPITRLLTNAIEEQAEGINQISTAVIQLDQVTQGNAASSEESASAGEELSAQAVELSDMVQQLVALIEGASDSEIPQGRGVAGQKRTNKPSLKLNSSLQTTNDTKGTIASRKISEQIIPLDEDDFGDF